MGQKKENVDQRTEQEKFWVSIGWTESDSRPSAIATGAGVGIVFCVLPLLIVFILDLPTLYRYFRRAMYNITGNEKYKPRKKTKKKKNANKTQDPRKAIDGRKDAVSMHDDVSPEDPGEGTSGLQHAITMPPQRHRMPDTRPCIANRRKKLIATRKLTICPRPKGVGETAIDIEITQG